MSPRGTRQTQFPILTRQSSQVSPHRREPLQTLKESVALVPPRPPTKRRVGHMSTRRPRAGTLDETSVQRQSRQLQRTGTARAADCAESRHDHMSNVGFPDSTAICRPMRASQVSIRPRCSSDFRLCLARVRPRSRRRHQNVTRRLGFEIAIQFSLRAAAAALAC